MTLPHNRLSENELDELAAYKPTLTYGQAKQASPEEFVPAYVAYDKKVSAFQWGNTCCFADTAFRQHSNNFSDSKRTLVSYVMYLRKSHSSAIQRFLNENICFCRRGW